MDDILQELLDMDGQTGPSDLKDLTTLERAIDLYLTTQIRWASPTGEPSTPTSGAEEWPTTVEWATWQVKGMFLRVQLLCETGGSSVFGPLQVFTACEKGRGGFVGAEVSSDGCISFLQGVRDVHGSNWAGGPYGLGRGGRLIERHEGLCFSR
jgi:hypothetical protein